MATRPQNVNDADLLWLASLIAVRLVLAGGCGSAAAEVALASDEVQVAVARAAAVEAAASTAAKKASAALLRNTLGQADKSLLALVGQLAQEVINVLAGDMEVAA